MWMRNERAAAANLRKVLEACEARSRVIVRGACGAGKTGIGLGIIAYFFGEERYSRALYVSPKHPLLNNMDEELGAAKLEGVLIFNTAKNPSRKARRDFEVQEGKKLVFTTPDKIGNESVIPDILILDEVTFFKNPRSLRSVNLKPLTKGARLVVGMTGSIYCQNLMDVFGVFAAVGAYPFDCVNVSAFEERFYKTVVPSRARYRPFSIVRIPKDGSVEFIKEKTIENSVRIDPLVVSRMSLNKVDCYFDGDAKILYDALSAGRLPKKGPTKALVSEYGSAAVNLFRRGVKGDPITKKYQLASGGVYQNGNAFTFQSGKDEIIKRIASSTDRGVLICYNYDFEIPAILRSFPEAEGISEKAIKAWNEGKLKRLYLHPKSGAHGLNLQKGGSVCVWRSLPSSAERFIQMCKRLDRPGQTEKVWVWALVSLGTVEDGLWKNKISKAISENEAWMEGDGDGLDFEL